jgi:hypothetical protein
MGSIARPAKYLTAHKRIGLARPDASRFLRGFYDGGETDRSFCVSLSSACMDLALDPQNIVDEKTCAANNKISETPYLFVMERQVLLSLPWAAGHDSVTHFEENALQRNRRHRTQSRIAPAQRYSEIVAATAAGLKRGRISEVIGSAETQVMAAGSARPRGCNAKGRHAKNP